MARKKARILLAADWSKNPAKRAVWKGDVETRQIERLVSPAWDLSRLLCVARQEVRANRAPVIISLDIVLGVPRNYFQQVQTIQRWRDVQNFVDWLALLKEEHEFWCEVKRGADWTVTRPFCSVPKGVGARGAFDRTAGYELLRDVDKRCKSQPPFVVNGIPGSVGSGTRALWRELGPMLATERDFKIWPFEGSLDTLLATADIAIAENFPRISYAAATQLSIPSPVLKVAKSDAKCRAAALDLLITAAWVRNLHVLLPPDLNPAYESEDEFDALLAVAGQLRCSLEGRSLDDPGEDDRIAEGGMLLTSLVDFDQTAATLCCTTPTGCSGMRHRKQHARSDRNYGCPIPQCAKVFRGTRSGWDPHVASIGKHPAWYPDVADPERRKLLFRQDFPGFFG